jgi:flagellar FliJ protein
MTWRRSLVRLADHQVEEIRKRLKAILDRRSEAEAALVSLHEEAEAESRHAETDGEAAWMKIDYLKGWRHRRDAKKAEIAELHAEEAGAREALVEAFETLKKYEQVAESARAASVKAAAHKETAVLDELGARRASAR